MNSFSKGFTYNVFLLNMVFFEDTDLFRYENYPSK